MARSVRAVRSSSVDPVAADPGTQPKLGDLLANLAVVELVCAPASLDVAVSEPVIHDPAAPPDLAEGAIVLAVGVPAKSADAAALMKLAGRARASAVAFKMDGPAPDPLQDAAKSSGVALLTLPREMTWSQLHSLIR